MVKKSSYKNVYVNLPFKIQLKCCWKIFFTAKAQSDCSFYTFLKSYGFQLSLRPRFQKIWLPIHPNSWVYKLNTAKYKCKGRWNFYPSHKILFIFFPLVAVSIVIVGCWFSRLEEDGNTASENATKLAFLTEIYLFIIF